MQPNRFGPGRRPLRGLLSGLWTRGAAGGAPLRRAREDRLLGGVAAGLAARTGLDVMLIRLAFVLATLLTFGAAVYVLAWLFIPMTDEDTNIASKAVTDRRGMALAAGLGSLLIVVLVIASALGAAWLGNLGWPVVIGVAGLALIWRNAPEDEQETMRRLAEPLLGLTGDRLGMTGDRGRRAIMLRGSVAGVLLISGLVLLLHGHGGAELLRPLGGILLVIAAIMVVLGPWWLRIARDLVVERQARVRAEERADMATRVHDSVLQTLALIQRNAGQPQQVVHLARTQERELRSWLFDGRAPGSVRAESVTLAAGVRLIQQEVEELHGVQVEAITVGDCDLDDRLEALLAAAREATVNAAKWSGAGVVSVFAEVEPGEVSLFVRDRGRGFDPAAVPGDRKGLAESVRARMSRRGGTAAIRSAPGEGTEVSLRMPRMAGKRQPSQA
jgi:signal transduction histidine kinase